jgi:hypothetical protein
MFVGLTSDRIKIAQHWCKGIVFPNIRKNNNNKKGPVVANQLDQKNNKFCLITSAFNFVVTFVRCLISHGTN